MAKLWLAEVNRYTCTSFDNNPFCHECVMFRIGFQLNVQWLVLRCCACILNLNNLLLQVWRYTVLFTTSTIRSIWENFETLKIHWPEVTKFWNRKLKLSPLQSLWNSSLEVIFWNSRKMPPVVNRGLQRSTEVNREFSVTRNLNSKSICRSRVPVTRCAKLITT